MVWNSLVYTIHSRVITAKWMDLFIHSVVLEISWAPYTSFTVLSVYDSQPIKLMSSRNKTYILIGNSSNNNHKMWWFLLLKGGDLNSYFQYFLLHRGNSMSITYWIFSVSSFICLPGRRSKFPKRWIDSHASRDGCLASHPFTLPHLFNLSEKSRCSLLQHTLLKNIFIYLSAASLLQAHRIFNLLCEMWGF